MTRLAHLARRFFGTLRRRPLRPAQQAEAAGLLHPEERKLFWGQGPADQRHALRCARAVLARAPGRFDLARAALLHDVGKGIVRLGVAGRVLATGLSLLRLPTPGRLGAYLEHGRSGADRLAAAGAEPLVVAYTRHHHDGRPAAVPAQDWELLAAADRA
ncbi:MAG TPA: hypothetical protein VLS92_05165 [Acidimicrobiia bacterium]|nr:hypothetical protein [Acidimicrobiia bacterium]